MHAAQPVSPVEADVLGPGAALDVDQHPACDVGELHEHKGGHVALLVGEGEVHERDALAGLVLHLADVVLVRRVLEESNEHDSLGCNTELITNTGLKPNYFRPDV